MATAAKTITYEEYVKLPETQDMREEVVNGEICAMPPAAFEHADLVEAIVLQFRRTLSRTEFAIPASSFGIVISRAPLRVRNPDIAVFRRNAMSVRDGLVHSAPELAVEILSPSNTRSEMANKLADYADLGIPEVWLVSREAQTIEVLSLAGKSYSQPTLLHEGILAPASIPQAALELNLLWAPAGG